MIHLKNCGFLFHNCKGDATSGNPLILTTHCFRSKEKNHYILPYILRDFLKVNSPFCWKHSLKEELMDFICSLCPCLSCLSISHSLSFSLSLHIHPNIHTYCIHIYTHILHVFIYSYLYVCVYMSKPTMYLKSDFPVKVRMKKKIHP